jgi:hypothetical protein
LTPDFDGVQDGCRRPDAMSIHLNEEDRATLERLIKRV